METHYTRQNMRQRGPMESRKLLDHFRQTASGVHALEQRKAHLQALMASVRTSIETGDLPGSIEGSVYTHAAHTGRQIDTVERWERND